MASIYRPTTNHHSDCPLSCLAIFTNIQTFKHSLIKEKKNRNLKMADKLDMSLDDIIKQNRNQYRVSGRGGGRSRGSRTSRSRMQREYSPSDDLLRKIRQGRVSPLYPRSREPERWQHDMFDGGERQASRSYGATKLLVSNLDYGVSDADVKELFTEFGPLRKAAVHYDRSGRSLGTADVIFERRYDALRAMKKYNGVPLDGRPMNIQIASSKVPNTVRGGSRRTRSPRNFNRNRRGTGRGRQQRGGGAQKKIPTAEELDAELEAYINKME